MKLYFDPQSAPGVDKSSYFELLDLVGGKIVLESDTPKQKTQRLSDLIWKGTEHSDRARHTLLTNWPMWFLGKAYYTFGFIRSPNTFLKSHGGALCSERSYLFVEVLLKNNVLARHVGLFGHVAAEVFWEGEWHFFDPDQGVVADVKGEILSLESLRRNPKITRKLYRDFPATVPLLLNASGHTYATIPRGAHFNYKADILFYMEKILEVLKYLLPIFGIMLTYRRRFFSKSL
ncbi:MAG: hypothetical protein GY915_09750 [bacterium]|nr:hypothetical protein [bacterium]